MAWIGDDWPKKSDADLRQLKYAKECVRELLCVMCTKKSMPHSRISGESRPSSRDLGEWGDGSGYLFHPPVALFVLIIYTSSASWTPMVCKREREGGRDVLQ